ncbi:MAG TPA: ATP-binding protein [Steroidobacter sp.]|uniref:ATP-binding protein n=1 Tax=Steroidobacter sp. TaxID=1978227 RepID=UPI002ED9DC32
MTASLQKTKVDFAGLMRVLGEALYSTPQVAIRELVQNAHDSCTRRSLEAPDSFEPAIEVTATPGTLTITDNGAGLTAEEIHSYLATVGAGYTRTLREKGAEGLIGYFGLGFLSAFAVSERVEVWTCSYQTPEVAHRFVSRSGETYTVERAEPRPIGTQLRLILRPAFPELGDAQVVLSRLQRYCCLLKYPVSLNGGTPVNIAGAPWRQPKQTSPLRLRTLSLEFARRFERVFQPIATAPVASPDNALSGLLWIQDGGSYATSDNRNISVFVRGMLIGEDERDLLPRWAGFIGGVIESNVLQPTASRESLRKDEMYQSTATALRECLIRALFDLAEQEPATWRRVLLRHNEALLGAALVDEELFKLVGDDVTVPTTEGDFTLPALLDRCEGKIYVTQSDRAGVESILLRALKLPVVLGTRYAAAPFCTRYTSSRRGQLVLLGTQGGDQTLFKPADLGEAQCESLRAWFAMPDRQVLVRRFDPAFLPFALVVDRDVELKRSLDSDEADRRIGQAVLGLARQFTKKIAADASVRMYVNAANPVVLALFDLSERQRSRALALLKPLATLTSGAQGEHDIEGAMTAFGDSLLNVLKEG